MVCARYSIISLILIFLWSAQQTIAMEGTPVSAAEPVTASAIDPLGPINDHISRICAQCLLFIGEDGKKHTKILGAEQSVAELRKFLSHPEMRIDTPDGTDHVLTSALFADDKIAIALIKLLIKHGAAVNSRDKSGYTVLMHAARDNRFDLMKYLIEQAGADVNLHTINDDDTALTLASAHIGSPEMVAYLISHGADLEARDGNGDTALLFAAEEGYKDVVTCLVEAGANIFAKNKFTDSVIDKAIIGIRDRARLAGVYRAIIDYLAPRMADRSILYALLAANEFIDAENTLEQFPPEHVCSRGMLKPLIIAALTKE